MVAVPDRLEEPVGEPQREDVLGRLLAQEMVDAEDLGLVEDLVHLGVELLGALEIRAERLLHDHPRPVSEARLAERVDHVDRGVGRHAQVVQAAGFSTQLAFGPCDGVGERRRSRAGGHIAQPGRELVERRVVVDLAAEVLACLPRQGAKGVIVQVLERGPHDPGVRDQTGLGQVETAGQELSLREVARGAEQDDDVRLQRRQGRRGDIAGGR